MFNRYYWQKRRKKNRMFTLFYVWFRIRNKIIIKKKFQLKSICCIHRIASYFFNHEIEISQQKKLNFSPAFWLLQFVVIINIIEVPEIWHLRKLSPIFFHVGRSVGRLVFRSIHLFIHPSIYPSSNEKSTISHIVTFKRRKKKER